jgi:hypothetical protein
MTTVVARLEHRLRAGTIVLIAGLILSGATAIPIVSEVRLAERILGADMSGGGAVPTWAVSWFVQLRDGILATAQTAPFMFYGTDWLAFGHFVIAGAFIGALRDPVRNRWLYQFGMGACLAVPVWAALFGPLRGIPGWWRIIDASFGVVGFVPAWLCHRWAGELERLTGAGR